MFQFCDISEEMNSKLIYYDEHWDISRMRKQLGCSVHQEFIKQKRN